MLIGLRIGNFRSFAGSQELSYVTSADRAHETTHCIRTGIRAAPRVSRAALIFGPNAGGKSNLILALSTLRDLVLNSTSFTDGQFAERYTPFRFDSDSGQPTEFEIEILAERIRYRYMIAYTAQRITAERLLVYRTGKSQRWFERRFDETRQTEEWTPFSPNFSGPREMWRKATRSKALFLTTAAQLNSELLEPLFHWFEYCLEIVMPQDVTDFSRLANDIMDPDLKARMLSIVHSADLPIEDFRVGEGEHAGGGDFGRIFPGAAPHGGAQQRPSIEFLHSHQTRSAAWLGASFESAGTHRLLGLLGPLLRTIDNGKLLVIDEFDTSLHPLLSRFLLQTIHYPVMGGRNAQLLLTSHNTTLMDLDILRRDEIWFIELDAANASQLSPLLKSSPRKHEMINKAYLRGRYGAIPQIHPEFLTAAGRAAPAARAPATSAAEAQAASVSKRKLATLKTSVANFEAAPKKFGQRLY